MVDKVLIFVGPDINNYVDILTLAFQCGYTWFAGGMSLHKNFHNVYKNFVLCFESKAKRISYVNGDMVSYMTEFSEIQHKDLSHWFKTGELKRKRKIG